jgi:hypothetical protein
MNSAEGRGIASLQVSREGTAIAFGGAHNPGGFCWCQPERVPYICARAHHHVRYVHRRAMDETSDMSDIRCGEAYNAGHFGGFDFVVPMGNSVMGASYAPQGMDSAPDDD